jgi:thiamine biosynthesis lipoprotein
MRSLVGAAIWAAERSGGLVDPTLAEDLERSGYDHSRTGAPCAPVAAALAVAPRRRVAAAEPDARWRTFHVDNERRVVERPPGVVFDPGAVGKALAADAVANRLHDYTRFVIDCDGDLRLGGTAAEWKRHFVRLRNPVSGRIGHVLEVTHGAVATSSLRPWHRNANGFTHALLDPATGAPAWTGIVSATAIAPTTLEADTLAKTAFLSGPAGARKVLGTYGGVTIDEAGRVELHAL